MRLCSASALRLGLVLVLNLLRVRYGRELLLLLLLLLSSSISNDDGVVVLGSLHSRSRSCSRLAARALTVTYDDGRRRRFVKIRRTAGRKGKETKRNETKGKKNRAKRKVIGGYCCVVLRCVASRRVVSCRAAPRLRLRLWSW